MKPSLPQTLLGNFCLQVYRYRGQQGQQCVLDWKEVGTWRSNWTHICTFFRYPHELRKIMYASNAIEGLHRRIRKVTKSKAVFPSSQALFKMLYLAINDIAKKGPVNCNGWKYIFHSLGTLFPNKFKCEEYIACYWFI
ncbi:MAG: transposase [Parachlamydiaceae bacterium]|nr:transposase [Parachlamydiaceae bacterium]